VLPRLLAKLEAAGASRQSVGVVIPTGYSFNLDGTCIYLTLGALFIVQASGQDMSIGQQIALAGLMILTSKGAAGITGAGLVTPDRLAAGVRRRVLLGRGDRRRHRARRQDRPHHERGPRADERDRQQRRDDGDRGVAGRARR
jgi:sodium:dicarboxylate symporter family protein